MQVFEIEYIQFEGKNIDFNYFLFKNLNSENLLQKVKELHTRALNYNRGVKYNLYLPTNYTSQDIVNLWNSKPANSYFVTIFEANLNNWEYTILLRQKLIEN